MEKTLKNVIVALIIMIVVLVLAALIITAWSNRPRKERVNYEKVASYFWTCRGDKKHESQLETKVLGVEIDENADYVLESGTYKIKYVTEGKDISPKVNRTYYITVIDFYTDASKLGQLGTVTYEYRSEPGPYPTEITVQKGQYIYLQHSANENAKDGNLYLIR